MRRSTRASLVLVGMCLLALPRGPMPASWPDAGSHAALNPWPLVQDVAWRVALWIDATRVERAALPSPAARADLVDETASAGWLLQRVLDDWQTSAEVSLLTPVTIALPYTETLMPDDDRSRGADASVQTYTVTVPPGERLRIVTRGAPGATGGLIIDVLDPELTRVGRPSMLASYGPDPLERRIAAPSRGEAGSEFARPGVLHVRVQATPAARGRFAILLDTQPLFHFPVDTDARSPVKSRFGVARDGGRRQHHGIDIFAERGTAVLAAADGVVVRTGDSTRGGLHLWQRAVDEAGQRIGSLYYAHLDRIDVDPGSRVRRGEQLGTVGNTGNARTTPPHLHFGLYHRFEGPIDPLPLTGEARRAVPDVRIAAALPRWLQVVPRRANLRVSADTSRSPITTLVAGQLVRVDGILPGGRWVRVRAQGPDGSDEATGPDGPDGQATVGWIARSLLGPPRAGEPVSVQGTLRAGPRADSPTSARLDPATQVFPLGRYGSVLRVRTADGLVGWIDTDEPAS